MEEPKGGLSAERPLKGWRAMAEYFGRDQSTVRRWAAEKQLPVHRAGDSGGRGVPVYAFASELEAWLRREQGRGSLEQDRAPAPDGVASRRADDDAPPSRAWRWGAGAAIAAGVVAVVAILVGGYLQSQGGWERAVGHASDAAGVPAAARELYLHGTYLWNRRTPGGIDGAIEALQDALEIEPDYADAHAGLAMAYNLARQYSGMSGWDAYPKAEEHARTAVALDPTDATSQSVLAFVEFHWLWDVEAGLARFEEALRLDPDSANTLMWYGSSLIHAGRHEDALVALERAQRLDPDNTTILIMKGQALFYSGREEEGLKLIQELIDRDPDHPWNYYAMALLRLGQLDFVGYLENYAILGDRIGVPRYRRIAEAGLAALREGGEAAMVEAMVELDTEFYERGEALAWDIAGHYAMVGNWQEAIPWLRLSLERHEERLIGLGYNTAFGPIRHRPEYKQLLIDIGLPSDA